MHFRFALELWNIDLWNVDLLETRLDLLGTDIARKYFVCLHYVFKASLRQLQDMSSRRLQDMSSRQDVFSVTIFCLATRLEDIFKTSSRRLGRR